MLDIRFIRDNADLVDQKAAQKGFAVNIKKLLEADNSRRQLLQSVELARSKVNSLTESFKGQPPSESQKEQVRKIKRELDEVEDSLELLDKDYQKLLGEVPNIFPDDTPLGGEEANRQERTWGDTKAKDFKVLDHLAWAEKRGLIDFERGAKVAGAKFYFTKGSLAQLEIALAQFGMAYAVEQGFLPVSVPHLVSSRVIDGAGFTARTKEEQQIYRIEDEDLNLIATAEIPLTGYHADEILTELDLPILYAGYSPAYRKEAGAYGKHSRGLYRVHQFNKLELYGFCKPADSESLHQKMVAVEEGLIQKLEIPYRVVRIAAGDLGAAAFKKYDIEYWSPVDNAYRELTSCSNVTDFQARRLKIRYKDSTGRTQFVHTLNGTAAAMSRLIIAIIENYQDKDGQVAIPKALQPFLNGQTTL